MSQILPLSEAPSSRGWSTPRSSLAPHTIATSQTWDDVFEALPTAGVQDGERLYWANIDASWQPSEDIERGSQLADATVAVLSRFPELSGCLARIVRDCPGDCPIGSAFFTRLEELLRPH